MMQGIAASPGIAIGKVLVLADEAAEGKVCVHTDQQQAFQQALDASKTEIAALRAKVSSRSGDDTAAVFDAHLLMLEDPSLLEPISQAIEEGANAVAAVQGTSQALAAVFAQLDDEYMRERAADIKDICRRLIRHLTGSSAVNWEAITEPVVLIAHDLTPSDTAQLTPSIVCGFATESGGKTSHSAILARTMGIPAVVGSAGLLVRIQTGDLAILDGEAGVIIINPDNAQLTLYETKLRQYQEARRNMDVLRDLPAVTTDGYKIELAANIGLPRDVSTALANGAEGVGLYRTEFLFMNRDTMPTEEEQYAAYKAVVEEMGGRPVIIRTLDVGGDKQIDYLAMPKEANPFLGWRAVRMCLDRPDLFTIQLRALWRAGCHGKLLVMFPMISSLDEVRQAKRLLGLAKEELLAEGKQVAQSLSVGIMIEIPSAALIADQLAREVEFFSIGSNDLIQYTIGVDRMNEQIAHLYQPLHPGVLNLIAMVIDAAHRHGKWVGMCGEMAGDISCVPLLIGLGLDEFSMSAGSISLVKQRVRNLSGIQCRQLAEKCLVAGTAEEVGMLVGALP
jgi:phosphotransferase system enzyme I (PtsI)